MLSDSSDPAQSLWPTNTDSLKYNPNSFRTRFGILMTGLAGLFTMAAIIPLFVVVSYLIINGIENISFNTFTQDLSATFTGDDGGFRNALLGTIIMVGIGNFRSDRNNGGDLFI